jgi:putative DNA methylase
MNGKDLWYKPKLIEVALPLEDISKASAREKAIRHGHPSTLHLWWSRKPLAAARAVLFAQLVDDPSAHPEQFPTEESQKAERDRLHNIISRFVVWENLHDAELFDEARIEILKSTGSNPPPILDPFAGGGSIPLEAQRLGLEAHASDLNPVAVLINKALIEIPPKWIGYPPVFPGAASERIGWSHASGLAEDVRRYGRWIRDEAENRIGGLYPKATISGIETPVVAWIWARTITCPNPACRGTMPLVSKFWLGKKKGKERYVKPIPEGKRVRFEIAGPDGVPREGTMTGRTGAVCLLCETPVPMSYIRDEGKAGRMGAQLMAIAAEGKRQRYYIAPSGEHEKAADIHRPEDIPEGDLPTNARWFSPPLYGMKAYGDLFTNRQLAALTTFSDLVGEARERVVADGGNLAYADAIATYLALAMSRITSTNSSLCRWRPDAGKESVNDTFGLQALPMVWEYAEGCPFTEGPPAYNWSISWVSRALDSLRPQAQGRARQADAASSPINELVATDPPYYDNIGYSGLSDFFYVWLRRTLGGIYPDLLGTMLTPKADELVADAFYHGGKENAEKFFEDGFSNVFHRIRSSTPDGYPITVFYAFKQSETDSDGGQTSTGWETLLEGMLGAGWTVTATWPIRTELSNRAGAIGANSLAASIALACRPRPADAGFTDRRGLINQGYFKMT